MEVIMNTFKSYSLAALSIMMLLSISQTQSMERLKGLHNAASQAAQNIWAMRPALPKVNLPSFSMAAIAKALPSQEQLVDHTIGALAKTVNFAESAQKMMNKYPKTATAAKIAPVLLVGGYIAKKAVNAFNTQKNASILPQEELVCKLDKDLLNGMTVTAIKVLSESEKQLEMNLKGGLAKIPAQLGFERNLSQYFDLVPEFLPELKAAWNNFIRFAIAHDNASDNTFGDNLINSFEILAKNLVPLRNLTQNS